MGHRRFMEIAERNDVAINVKPMDLSSKVFPVPGDLPVAQRPKQRLS